ncbi:MAG: ABC transporter ATP-binding protein [Burkholderiaceae bacterium]|nr:ABC transporter ATP-binding protein [Burkholderiaceae bacterium]
MVELRDLWLTYPGAAQPSVRGVSLRVEPGEFVTLLGPSGCGKTSTLRSIAGLETPSAGAISIGSADAFNATRGVDVPTHQRDISMVFQSYAVWPHMTVAKNVAFPLEVAKRPMDEVRTRVAEVLQMVGLTGLADRSATQLSGGQQQRVAIARALVRRSAVMLLDEPLSNLDAKLREQMRLELRQLLKTVGLTAVYVTHDQEEALMLSDRIALMSAGKFVEVGTPLDLYLKPRTLFGATFLGAAEVFEVVRTQGTSIETKIGHLHVETATTNFSHVGIRPEAIRVRQQKSPHPSANQLQGTLVSAVFSGRQQQLIVQLDAGRQIHVLAEATTVFRAGESITVEFPVERLMGLTEEASPD